MAQQRAPKQWCLTKSETITSFESWRQNLLYSLSLDSNFATFLKDDFTWQKKSTTQPTRGLTDDGEAVAAESRKTAAQKLVQLELMLGQIANFCPVIARNAIVRNSTSVKNIWQTIRQHYGFQSSGSQFLDLASIRLDPDERPEDLYQRLMMFVEDNLLTTTGDITHHGDTPDQDEDISPSLENMITLMWLQLIHPGLPQLVKQKYGAELRNKTLSSIKPEISQALTSLLDELKGIEETRAMRTSTPFRRDRAAPNRSSRSCILCKTARRPNYNTHFLSQCRFLPEADRSALAKSRLVQEVEDEDDLPDEVPIESPSEVTNIPPNDVSARRVDVIQSPTLTAYYQQYPVRVTLDTGATTNMIRANFAKYIGAPIHPATQSIRQADGKSQLKVVGEVHCTLKRGSNKLELDALVVEHLDVDILAGNPFMVNNDIATRPSKNQISIGEHETIHYGSRGHDQHGAAARRAQAFVLRGPDHPLSVPPGSYLEVHTPDHAEPDELWALEPRPDIKKVPAGDQLWPPHQLIQSVGHCLRIANTTDAPVLIGKHEHFCQVVPTMEPRDRCEPHITMAAKVGPCQPYAANITVDPDHLLDSASRDRFIKLHDRYDNVFNPAIGKYNGKSGKIEATVNMGPVLPPQRKGRLPQYNRDKLQLLQEHFDTLEASGVFAKPEQVNTVVEYLNPSFLVKKPNGSHRLVTAFGDVAQYSKPQPSLMPDVDSTLRAIAGWKYLIKTDLQKAYYQIPLSSQSMKYCGVATPFKGVRVYTRGAMGMPGSETALEELMSRILGHLVQEGRVAKLADDLYCGGSSPTEALRNWEMVLDALHLNNLRLSASKTIICPASTTILGWIWSSGTLKASPHRTAALSQSAPPETVHGLRSFLGSYKVLSRVLKGYADLLHPLESAISGLQSKDKVTWSEELRRAFSRAKEALSDTKTITLPRAQDTLWVVTDASVKQRGIGATLYVLRDDDLLLAGFFNAKLRKHQVAWLPCELEALCIASALKHFSPFIIQSDHQCQVLTDSKPCVQAYDRLCRGEFSASSRVTSFLSTVSRYSAKVTHIAGVANLPSDFASRHPVDCFDRSCQICRFIAETEDSVVRQLSVSDVTERNVPLPFTSRAAWLATQHDCPDLRRTHAHLTQGTRPTKKQTSIKDVKRYLQSAVIASDGLLVIHDYPALQPRRERIIVPRTIVPGLLTALHLKLSHPSASQLKLVFNRRFFALDLDKAAQAVSLACDQCQAVRSLPSHLQPQLPSFPPETVGHTVAADVMRRCKQFILVARETTTSYSAAIIIDDEKHETLRTGLIHLCAGPLNIGTPTRIRVDPAPGFIRLDQDQQLSQQNIQLEYGDRKNPNKNPVAEKAIRELAMEILHLAPAGGPISSTTLTLATRNLNSRIRSSGLSATELWTQRDQFSGEQLAISDRDIIHEQLRRRLANNPSSAKSKGGKPSPLDRITLSVGDLVYLKGERDKTKARERYIVCDIEGEWGTLRKFTKDQFRSRTYNIRLTECYKVPCSVPPCGPKDPVRGLEETTAETDHAAQPRDYTQAPELVYTTPTPPPAVTPPPLLTTIPSPAELCAPESPAIAPAPLGEPIPSSSPSPTKEPPTASPPPPDTPRPLRSRKRPSYLDEYVTDY